MMPTSRLLLAGLLLTGVASAQAPVSPAPAGAPVVPAAVPPLPAAGLAEKVKQDGYLEPKINGERLAELYSELTGRRVTVSNAAIAAEFRFVQKGPITYAEATELLKIAAVMEGFVFIPSGENHDKLVYSQSVASPTDEDLAVITDPADLPEGEQVVRYVMTLKYIKPDEMVRAFTSIVKQFGNFGSIVAVPNASSLIITENTSLIRSLIELQETIDVASQNVETRFIKVQYADVQELSETLNEILGTQQQGQTSAGIQRVQPATPVQGGGVPNIGNAAAGATAAAGVDGGGAGEDVPIQIVPNARTNEIFVMGRPVDIVFAEGLIKGFDSPSDTRNSLSRKLKFLPVADFLPVAEQALQRAFSGSAEGGSAGGGSAGGGRPTGANFGGAQGGGTRGAGSGRNSTAGNGSFGSGSTGGFGGTSGGGGGIGGSSLGEPNVSSAPTSLLVGRTLLVADNITNSIVIQGPPASVEIINQLLDKIDVKADQVMISCVFGQLSLGDDLDYGVDYLRTLDRDIRGNNAFAGQGGSGGSNAALPLDGAAFVPGDFTAAPGLGIYGKIGRYMNVYLKALQDSSRFNVISRPTVFMANNQKGTIKSGQQVAVPTTNYTSGTVGGTSTNIEYRDVALSLEVIPLVNSKDEVTLQIYLLNDEIVDRDEIEGVGSVPVIATRELVTTVTVPNNETIVLGGLITARDSKTRAGIPILSQLPYLGSLFGSTSKKEDREELLIFIQPQIINDDKSLYQGQGDMEGRYKLDEQNREFIDGPGVDSELPNSKPELNDGKASENEKTPARESAGGPRRASARPRSGFVNRR
ncbi:MAG: hypothetical protein EAZ65_01275 [Verrucomicrobia bacterium]|nr:MAG: hypothetical protein EAZ84_06190 [Verrucomicrobiota bacterium]TAE89162.1 MAG: hypothetical protein EAZ82_00625 [Verrucomicrobiota bacterium]TAF27963.1 MAG: hypothetical protein EAZ71_01280 [Verrucomicrobiota bacterium]TAF42811.1 MAG: hypothetical protein EAZ65_01275 [Verrucomicrobiota bacterium]